ncbi:TonB-dependent siderophore receptor [Paraburkholderia sp. PREW-6R]|uniref:TonB-dependent receptor n=1 Tax=Paraburkholderia sp. PREW-6R TaxID=3141544 RepID=UPI0031F530D0
MLKHTPLATALALAFAVPFATPAVAQTAPQAASQPSADTAPASAKPATNADGTTLPAVGVTARAEQQDFQPERSTVGAKTPTALRDIPQTVTVINKAVLESQGATSFQDALRNAPGVTIGAAEGGQIGNNINLRGFTAQNDIYLDGFRDRNQYYRDTFDLEQIEVLYGPSSMLFGRGSTGGVINQVSKKANLKDSAEVTGMIGTDDRYRSTVDVNHKLTDTSAIRLNAFGQSLGSSRDEMKNKDYGIAPEVRFGIGTPTEVTISALIQHNYDMPDYGVQALNGRPAPVSKNTFYGLTTDRTIQDVQTFNAAIKHKFSDALTLTNQTQFSHSMTDARETAPQAVLTGPLATSTALTNGNYTSLSPSQLFIKLQSHDRVIQNHSLYNDTALEYKFDTGPIRHDVIAGFELGHDSYSNQAYTRNNLPVVTMVNPQYLSSPAGVTTTLGNYADSGSNEIGAYVNDTVSLGQHWKLVGGLRWDRFQAQIHNTVSLPRYATQTNFFTSVRAGVIYQPTDWQSYYVSYGTSFNPSLEALTVTNLTQNLAPESTKSYEVGGKWDLLGGNISVNSAFFREEKNNARTQVSPTEYELDGDVRVDGFQTNVTGHITDKWQVFGGYTYMNAIILKALDGTQGHVPANTPRNTITIWTTYALTPHWELGGGPIYMSPRYASNTNYVKVPGYTRWDVTAAYHAKKYDVRLNLLNLTNKQYYDGLIASDGGRSVPGIGRTLLATFDYRF